ncbi:hypothetical protein DPMN_172465 [Dreissena polymorpha]|uniref:Uncharacterized protein n=1 Tax=Dreissena polymorpha TaxID=45954 RepID=A0A9D4E1P0_DREPO|nr:hypothetical protein DPMN_172465 [Dreissena polymorpha]
MLTPQNTHRRKKATTKANHEHMCSAKCISPISLTISPLSRQVQWSLSHITHSPYPHLADKCSGVSPISLTVSPLSSQTSAVECLPYHSPYPHLAAKCSGVSPISLTISPLSSQVQWSLSFITYRIPTEQPSAISICRPVPVLTCVQICDIVWIQLLTKFAYIRTNLTQLS